VKILLTNDDGYNSRGISLLFDTLSELGHDVYIVAPSQERSGASHSITLHRDLVAEYVEDKVIRVSGTPADCVVYAVQMVGKDFDLVISGINAGQNMGEDIFYSGTVAAATEACFLGFPSLAFSLNEFKNQKFETGVAVVVRILEMGLHKKLKKNELLNINIPNISYEEIEGFKLTRLGERRYHNFMHYIEKAPKKVVYRVGGDTPEWSVDEKSDFYAVSNNRVSITHLLRKSSCITDLNSLGDIDNYEI